ncbi:hypothetical protein KKF82_06730 [Patescibacteria group bacterium]|uniref:Uncharacterized protein n=1 Tax=viral metagenome TaxID=1070528 RepID=A0A6M3X4E7_9ZZZZ|nr:hypothetical protein [Patescibacteria group bacterium]
MNIDTDGLDPLIDVVIADFAGRMVKELLDLELVPLPTGEYRTWHGVAVPADDMVQLAARIGLLQRDSPRLRSLIAEEFERMGLSTTP